MNDDVLSPWIAAYREENPGTALDAIAIRRRVLLGVGARQRRRLKALRFVVPVAATFFGSAALAASQVPLPRLDDVREWFGIEAAEPAPKAPARARARGARAPLPTPTPTVETPASRPAEQAPIPVETPVETLSLDDLPAEKPQARVAPTEKPRPDPLGAELRAYQTAHRLHFDGGDPAQALAAWNEYLGAHPSGTFAPEARFNRAVCLLRLGRRDEARSALVPIAEDGSLAYGSERARALLDAMGD